MLVQFATFLTIEKGTGGEMCLAIVSRIFIGDAPVSYWSFFPIPGNSPRSLCESGNLDNREFKHRRFRATHVKRKWSFCTLRNKFLDISSL